MSAITGPMAQGETMQSFEERDRSGSFEIREGESAPRSSHCSTVSLIDFQMTVANLSVAEHALREEPYERLPYLAGTIQVAQSQMESLRQEAMELKRVLGVAMEACRTNLTHAHRKDEQALHNAFLQCQKILNP